MYVELTTLHTTHCVSSLEAAILSVCFGVYDTMSQSQSPVIKTSSTVRLNDGPTFILSAVQYINRLTMLLVSHKEITSNS